MPAREIMAELFGKKTGICRGQGGSMHMFSKKHGLVSTEIDPSLSSGGGDAPSRPCQLPQTRIAKMVDHPGLLEGGRHAPMNILSAQFAG